jgi:hypothetical protein
MRTIAFFSLIISESFFMTSWLPTLDTWSMIALGIFLGLITGRAVEWAYPPKKTTT